MTIGEILDGLGTEAQPGCWGEQCALKFADFARARFLKHSRDVGEVIDGAHARAIIKRELSKLAEHQAKNHAAMDADLRRRAMAEAEQQDGERWDGQS